MVKINSIDDIVTNSDITVNERVAYMRDWLKRNYDFAEIADTNWIIKLSEVHDHDNLPKHFGLTKIGTSFSEMGAQLVIAPEGWHLAVSRKGETQPTVIHPKQEKAAKTTLNLNLTTQLAGLLKNGKLTKDNTPLLTSAPEFAEAPNFNSEVIVLPEPKNDGEDSSELAKENIDPTELLTNKKTTSVTVDLSQFM